MRCDQELMRRVLQNLTDNAFRFTPEAGRIAVAARLLADAVGVRVIDEGIGIPVESREAVFERWKRLESSSERSASGRGLGLAFCKLAVESHGGTISIESNEPRGTQFVVRLPSAQARIAT